MLKSILISRESDGTILCELVEDSSTEMAVLRKKNEAKQFLKNMKNKPSKCSIRAEEDTFQ